MTKFWSVKLFSSELKTSKHRIFRRAYCRSVHLPVDLSVSALLLRGCILNPVCGIWTSFDGSQRGLMHFNEVPISPRVNPKRANFSYFWQMKMFHLFRPINVTVRNFLRNPRESPCRRKIFTFRGFLCVATSDTSTPCRRKEASSGR